MNNLPFELPKYDKTRRYYYWNRQGMKFTDEEFNIWYNKYIYATNCELCNKLFKNTKDRQLDHNHDNGEIRNIVCNQCNQLKEDKKLSCNNTSGYKNIHKEKDKTYKLGYKYVFYIYKNGKRKKIKTTTDLEWLIEFAEKWKKENKYHT